MFGYGKPRFQGTKKEWNELQHKIAWKIDILSIYPFIVVKCPHCDAINVHNSTTYPFNHHHKCKLRGYYDDYACPGYYIGIITE
jgi:hypothetical protein